MKRSKVFPTIPVLAVGGIALGLGLLVWSGRRAPAAPAVQELPAPPPEPKRDSIAWSAKIPPALLPVLREVGLRLGFDPSFIAALIEFESGWDPGYATRKDKEGVVRDGPDAKGTLVQVGLLGLTKTRLGAYNLDAKKFLSLDNIRAMDAEQQLRFLVDLCHDTPGFYDEPAPRPLDYLVLMVTGSIQKLAVVESYLEKGLLPENRRVV